MPTTAKNHFDQDVARARKFVQQAEALRATDVDASGDAARAGVVFAVAGLDAYLCDAYVDTLTRTMRACRNQGCTLPGGYAKELLPAGPLFAAHYTQRANWALRMAARAVMEKDNLLQVSRVKDLLNPALPPGRKLWLDVVPAYAALNRPRLTRHTAAHLAGLNEDVLAKATKEAAAAILGRIGTIVQRRHDIVHNCDRPRYAYQGMTPPQAKKMLADVVDFVAVLDTHLDDHRVY